MTGVLSAGDRDHWSGPGPLARFRVLLVQAEAASGDAAAAIALVGGHVARRIGWPEIAAAQDDAEVVVLDAHGVSDDRIEATLAGLGESSAALIAAFAPEQIDVVASGLIDRRAHLLCEPTTGDWLTALFVARDAGPGAVLREGESERIAQLNAEIARLAELLARLTPHETGSATFGDRRLGFTGLPPVAHPVRAESIRHVIRARRLRDRFFGAGLFEDPAWDMLLDLFAAQLEDIQVSVSSLCIAAAVAPTTALRWIGRLTDAGLLARHADPRDRRRANVTLTAVALDGFHRYLAALREAGLTLG